jgi:hypothetical protein
LVTPDGIRVALRAFLHDKVAAGIGWLVLRKRGAAGAYQCRDKKEWAHHGHVSSRIADF